VLGARNILARDGETSDPYCKIKYKKVNTIKSDVVKKTVNPSWELPVVEMGKVDAAGYKAFMIKLWDEDTFGDDFIGALKLRPGMFFGGITPGQHDLWLPLSQDVSISPRLLTHEGCMQTDCCVAFGLCQLIGAA
jgi:hypothetical protein